LSYMTADHRMLMQTFNFCMIPLWFFFAYVFLFLPREVLSTKQGTAVLVLNAAIFFFRSAAELIFGDIRTGEAKFFLVLCLIVGGFYLVPVAKGKVSRSGLKNACTPQ
jgi:hypothetical protein